MKLDTNQTKNNLTMPPSIGSCICGPWLAQAQLLLSTESSEIWVFKSKVAQGWMLRLMESWGGGEDLTSMYWAW